MNETPAASTLPWHKLGGTTMGGKIAFHAMVFLIALLILFSRRPDALLNPQFYAEDGTYWYVNAYEAGFRCLLMPNGGYLNTLSRLIGLIALLVPFAWAPLVMILSAMAAHILPVNIFLSSRFEAIPIETRLLGCLIYLGVPNSFEIHANTTNIQWHLALAGFLLLLAPPRPGRAWGIFEVGIWGLSVLDGPLGVFLIPVAGILRWKRRDKQSLAALKVLVPGAVLQILFILLSDSRPTSPNGATIERFTRILGGQIFLSALLGLRTFIQLYFAHVHFLLLVQVVALVIGLSVMAYAACYGPFELKLFLLYAAIALSLALVRPYAIVRGNYEQWGLMLTPGITNRYWFFPMLAFLASLIWMVSGSVASRRPVRYAALALLTLLAIGIYRDWIYRPFPDLDFREFAADFERATPGTRITIPINPLTWEMQFTKR
jgi:hypothetical protein